MKDYIESQTLQVFDPKEAPAGYCDYMCDDDICDHGCGKRAVVSIHWREKRVARNNRWITTDYYRHYCKCHLLEMATADNVEGQIIRSERLRIAVLAGINVCEKVK